MEIRKMTCPKCGGAVRMDGNLAGGICPSCGMKFGLGSEAPLTVPEAKPAVFAPEPCADDYRPGAPAARGRLSLSDERRELARREDAARAAEEANREAKEASLSAKDPAQSSLIDGRLKSAFRAINAKQWMRADTALNDILKVEPGNEEALRGKRLVAAHKTDLPEEKPVAEAVPAAAPAAVPAAAPVAEAPKEHAPAPVAVTPVLVPETETGRRAESEIADTDRRMTARLSDSIDRKRNQKLLTKSNQALSKRKWKKATSYADEILKTDPESAYAYRNRLLAELRLPEERLLSEYEGNLSDKRNFLLALNYSSGALCRRLLSYVDPSTRAALMFERSLAFREMERAREAEAITDRRVAEITASLPANYNDEAVEQERNERISKILDRADSFREQEMWGKAEDLYHSALRVDGECADAYIGLLLVSLKLNQEKKLAHCDAPFGTDPNFLLAMHYGSRVMRRRLERYLAVSGQIVTNDASGMIVLPPQGAALPNAAGSRVDQLCNEMNQHLETIERLLMGGVPVGAAPAEAIDDGIEYGSAELRNTERKLKPFFRRARKLHKRGRFSSADNVYADVLRLDPANGEAYIGRLLCDLQIRHEKNLAKSYRSFSGDEFYLLALRFSTPDVGIRLTKAADQVDRRLGTIRSGTTEKLSRSERKRLEELNGSRRDAVIHDAERRTQAILIAGTRPRAKAEDEALADANRLIRRKKFAKARVTLDDLLARSPDFAGAYLARLLCTCSCRKPSDLKKLNYSFRDNPDYILACHFGQRKTRRRLAKYADAADKRAERAGIRTDAEWAQIRDVELSESRQEQETVFRISGDQAELRRVKLDAYAVKTAASVRRTGRSKPEHEKTLRRGYKALKRKKWTRAQEYFEQIRNDDAASCPVYVGLLLASLGLREERDLARANTTFSDNRYYLLALYCADARTADRLREYADRADRRFGKKNAATHVTYTELARRREDVTNRRINELEKRNRDLETELAKRGSLSRTYSPYADDDPDYYVHDGGRFASLKVALFLLGVTLAVAAIGAVAFLIVRYHGNVGEMIDGIKNAFGK